MTDTTNAPRSEAREEPKPAENQKSKQPAPQNEPVDPLDTGCGFIPKEGI